MTGSSSYTQAVCIAVDHHGFLVCSDSYSASGKSAALYCCSSFNTGRVGSLTLLGVTLVLHAQGFT